MYYFPVQVTMSENIEKWLSSLLYSTQETISSLVQDIVMECGALSVDDCASKVHVPCMYLACNYIITTLVPSTSCQYGVVLSVD